MDYTTSDNKRVNAGDAIREVIESIKESTDGTYYIETIDTLHQTVHLKKMHTVSYTKLAVADGDYLRIRLVASANKDMHTRIAWTSEGKSRLKSYVGTTYTADGAVYTPFNRQTSEPSTLEASIYIDPTINVLGPQRGDDFIGSGGATASRVGGTGAADIETIINAGTELLLEIQNVRGSASDLNTIINVYERNKFE